MACLEEKVTAGISGAAVVGAGASLIGSTATGPAFFGVAVGWLAACANFGLQLHRLSVCLENNGQPEMASVIREKGDAIEREIDEFKAWAQSLGVQF